ncbi:hypothetical protein [Streptomyces sp. NPDC005408]|uniref:hypothetical protein n=1 Tax=Streptomyces sp. NPDC005408 TaxID=3155341 RepID=UPI0033A43E15
MALAGCAAFTLSACGSGDKSDDATSPAPTSSTPAPKKSSASSDPQAAEKAHALSAYAHYREEQVKAYAKASADGTDLKKYVTADALGRVTVDLLSLKSAGNVATGAPVSDAEVSTLDLTGKIPKATVKDCVDVTNWKVVNRATGKTLPAPKGQLKRYIKDVTLEKWGKQWMVLTDTSKARAC